MSWRWSILDQNTWHNTSPKVTFSKWIRYSNGFKIYLNIPHEYFLRHKLLLVQFPYTRELNEWFVEKQLDFKAKSWYVVLQNHPYNIIVYTDLDQCCILFTRLKRFICNSKIEHADVSHCKCNCKYRARPSSEFGV